jgi:polyketide biosynthesis 3-hydroxy-3-methylglutaryl-CoA synthase-like enzyme PksG
MSLGIESINAYTGRTSLDVRRLFEVRGLDMERFSNLMMEEKSVNLPCEDPVTNAVNAARPIVDALAPGEKERIELLIVGTESGLDFGKPISTYVHHHLGLPRRCRSFEVKHACYGGTAALHTAAGMIARSGVPGIKALVIATDAASAAARDTYWEPSQGAGAVAMVVGERPEVLELDPGASGYHSYEVMDTCRPRPDLEAGDSDLSLLSYLSCLEECYAAYRERVVGADLRRTFDYLVFHTPFAGMVKGAHRMLLRKLEGAEPAAVEADFATRLSPSLRYCVRVGNVYSAALYLALCSLIDAVELDAPKRVALFSYGSGCASELYSGVIPPGAKAKLAAMAIPERLEERHPLTMEEYETIADLGPGARCGTRSWRADDAPYRAIYEEKFAGRGLLVLRGVENFHRRYGWS